MDPLAHQYCLETLDLIQRAPDRPAAELVEALAGRLGCAVVTAYRHLRKLGWSSGRKTRADKGQSKVGADEVRLIAALTASGRDLKGRPNLPVSEAVAIAQERGLLQDEISPSTVLRRLNAMHLGPRQMLAPSLGVSRISQHPNHYWVVDVSPCLQWYFKDGDGRRIDLYMDGGARFYAGKPQNFPKRRLLRYVVTDHYSGAYFAQYYYAEGENALDMVDFLWRAFAPKRTHRAFPFRGLPCCILADQGPGFKSHIVTNLLRDLGVDIELHASGNAKASGSVESRHYHWQRRFDARLKLQPARDVAELNRVSEDFCAVQNGSREHTRHGKPPLEVWCRIQPEQLREAPDRATYFALASGAPKTGTLTNRGWLRASGRCWQLRGDGVYAGMKVQYRLMPFSDQGIRVWTLTGVELAAAEIAFDEAGFPTQGARSHTWGAEEPEKRGATAPLTAGQDIAARVAAGEVEVALPGVFDFAAQLERQAFLSATGSEWAPPMDGNPLLTAPVLSRVDVLERISAALDRWLSDEEIARLTEAVGEGATEADLPELLALLDVSTPAARRTG